MSFNGLRDLVSDSMSIDMGSASTIIAVRGRGIIVDEPSIVAVNKVSGEVVAIGKEADEMQGREPATWCWSRHLWTASSPISSGRRRCSTTSCARRGAGFRISAAAP